MNRPVVQLTSDSPISSVGVVDKPSSAIKSSSAPVHPEAESQKVRQAIRALEQATEEIQNVGRELLASHREQLVRLSIEIAAKVLAKDIHERNYEIEKILSQALEEVPQGKPVTVKLNPEDLKTCQQTLAQQTETQQYLHLAADGSVGPGECVLETEQGVIEWIIEDHLKRISSALLGSYSNS